MSCGVEASSHMGLKLCRRDEVLKYVKSKVLLESENLFGMGGWSTNCCFIGMVVSKPRRPAMHLGTHFCRQCLPRY